MRLFGTLGTGFLYFQGSIVESHRSPSSVCNRIYSIAASTTIPANLSPNALDHVIACSPVCFKGLYMSTALGLI